VAVSGPNTSGGEAAVFVLGMARSGTSAVARVLHSLGVPVAREDDLMPADEGNPTGYWESLSLTGMNERLLSKLAGSWHSPPAHRAGWESDVRLDGLVREAAALLDRAQSGSEWVWKDPRNCFMLPFWRGVTSARPIVVLVYRDPHEMVDSLSRRNGFSAALSLALWERFSHAALASATGLPAFALRYERLVEDPAAVVPELRAFLRDLALLDRLAGAHEELVTSELPPESPWAEPLLAGRRRVLGVEADRRRLEAAAGRRLRLRPRGLELRVVPGGTIARALASTRGLARRLSP